MSFFSVHQCLQTSINNKTWRAIVSHTCLSHPSSLDKKKTLRKRAKFNCCWIFFLARCCFDAPPLLFAINLNSRRKKVPVLFFFLQFYSSVVPLQFPHFYFRIKKISFPRCPQVYFLSAKFRKLYNSQQRPYK